MNTIRTKILGILMVVLTFSMLSGSMVSASGSSPIVENVIITLGDPSTDISISHAIDSLVKDISGAQVLQFGTPQYYWSTAFQVAYNYIVVGHGSKDHIMVNSREVTWNQFSKMISSLSPLNKIHFLNCDSANINGYIEKSKLGFSFPGTIDASIGGAIIASFINADLGKVQQTKSAIQHLFQYIRSYSLGLTKMNFLRLDYGGGGGGSTTPPPPCQPYQSTAEFGWGALGLALTVAINVAMLQSFAGLIEKYQNPAINSVNELVGRASLLEKMKYSIGLALGSSGPLASIYNADLGEFTVAGILSVGWSLLQIAVTTIPIMVDLLFQRFDMFDMLFSTAAITASVALLFVDVESGGLTFFLKLVAAAWPTYKAIRNILYNAEDCNGTWEPQYTGIFGLIQLI